MYSVQLCNTINFRRTAFSVDWRPQIICESFSYYLRCRCLLVAAPRRISDPMPKHFLELTIRTMPCSRYTTASKSNTPVLVWCLESLHHVHCISFLGKKNPIKSFNDMKNVGLICIDLCAMIVLYCLSNKTVTINMGVSLKHSKLWDNTVVGFF